MKQVEVRYMLMGQHVVSQVLILIQRLLLDVEKDVMPMKIVKPLLLKTEAKVNVGLFALRMVLKVREQLQTVLLEFQEYVTQIKVSCSFFWKKDD